MKAIILTIATLLFALASLGQTEPLHSYGLRHYTGQRLLVFRVHRRTFTPLAGTGEGRIRFGGQRHP